MVMMMMMINNENVTHKSNKFQCLQYITTFIPNYGNFEAFTAMNIQVTVFWVVTQYSVVVGYRRFG
jgi:hypothetical protein